MGGFQTSGVGYFISWLWFAALAMGLFNLIGWNNAAGSAQSQVALQPRKLLLSG
jgi:hypothetical protein